MVTFFFRPYSVGKGRCMSILFLNTNFHFSELIHWVVLIGTEISEPIFSIFLFSIFDVAECKLISSAVCKLVSSEVSNLISSKPSKGNLLRVRSLKKKVN
jgi:hypothetical protein